MTDTVTPSVAIGEASASTTRCAMSSASRALEHLGEEQGEFVATESSGGVGAAQALVEASGDLDEDCVAGRMSVFGVDPPEVLEVDRDDADHMALRVTLDECSLDAINEEHAIGELGERVVKRAIGKLALESGEPEEPLMQAASLDRQSDDGRQLLEVLIVAA